MRCVSFLLMILAVAGTSSVRGQQSEVRDAVRDAVLEGREPARDARREVRETRRDERRESLRDRDSDVRAEVREALSERFAMRCATRCLKGGSRQETHAARCARHVETSGESRSATAIRMCGLRFVSAQ